MNPILNKHLNRLCLVLLASLMFTTGFSQDEESDVSVILLEHDDIAEVNIDQEPFLESLKSIIDYLETNLKDVAESQKIGVHIIAHPKKETSIICYTSPKNESLEDQLENGLKSVTIPHTKLVDFPILFLFNNSSTDDLNGFVDPIEAKKTEFKAADLPTKASLLKSYAISEVIPVLAGYARIAEDQFPGVKNFGNLVAQTDFSQEVDVLAMTDKNNDYWRATLEMVPSNQLIPLTKVAMLISQGEFDYAMRYLEIISMYTDPKTITNKYLEDVSSRLGQFYAELNKQVTSGIAQHDKQNYTAAIEIYEQVLNAHPKSAWALYEHYFSTNQLQVDKKEKKLEDYTNWYAIKSTIYGHNPVYDVDVHATTGEEAYAMFRRQEIQQLFRDQKKIIDDLYTYGEIALDLDAPAIAAQLFWISASVNEEKQDESLNYFLYSLNKLGNTEIKTNFKGDFNKIFKKLDTERTKQMKASSSYKMMVK